MQNISELKIKKKYVYDFKPFSYQKRVRLRTDGNTTTLCIKDIQDESKISGTKELEIVVEDFDKTNQILEMLGYDFRAYQENIRTSYRLKGCDVEIDQWPMIPTYLEIEGESIDAVKNVLNLIGLKDYKTTSENTTAVYKRYGIDDLKKIKELRF